MMAAPAVAYAAKPQPLDLELPEDFYIPGKAVLCYVRVLSGKKFMVKVYDPNLDPMLQFWHKDAYATPGWRLFPEREGHGPIRRYPKLWNTITPDQAMAVPAKFGNHVSIEVEGAGNQIFILSENSPWLYETANTEFFELTLP
jgi:hypothetical protein